MKVYVTNIVTWNLVQQNNSLRTTTKTIGTDVFMYLRKGKLTHIIPGTKIVLWNSQEIVGIYIPQQRTMGRCMFMKWHLQTKLQNAPIINIDQKPYNIPKTASQNNRESILRCILLYYVYKPSRSCLPTSSATFESCSVMYTITSLVYCKAITLRRTWKVAPGNKHSCEIRLEAKPCHHM